MATKLHFTKARIEALPTPAKRVYYRDSAEPKLGLSVTLNGTRSFFASLTIGGKTKRVTLGRFPDLSVTRARQKARHAASQVAEHGIDPVEEKRTRKASSVTLNAILSQYLDERDLKPSTQKDYRRAIRETFGDLLDRPFAAITDKAVLNRYLERGQASKARTDNAARVLRALFNYARARFKKADGTPLFPTNPTDILNDTKVRYRIQRKRRVIATSDLSAWWQAVHALDNVIIRDYLLFLLLTGTRRTEAASLRWENIDFRAGAFRLTDTKNRRQVELPLPDTVATLLRQRQGRKHTGWVFPARTGKTGYLSDPRDSIARVCSESGVDFSPHDLRRTFISIANGLDVSMYTVKALVNHAISQTDVTAGYDVPDMERLKQASRRIEDKILRLAGVKTAQVVPMRSAQ